MWLAGSLHEAVVAIASRRGSLGKMGDYETVLGEVRRSDMMRGIWSSYVSASPYAEGVDFAESRGQWCRVPQLRCAQRRAKPVHDGARMRRGVSQRVRAPEHVVFVPHPGIAPPICAEEVKVGEGAEGRKFKKHPRRHLANRVPRDEADAADGLALRFCHDSECRFRLLPLIG